METPGHLKKELAKHEERYEREIRPTIRPNDGNRGWYDRLRYWDMFLLYCVPTAEFLKGPYAPEGMRNDAPELYDFLFEVVPEKFYRPR